jgi:hypothetical protein
MLFFFTLDQSSSHLCQKPGLDDEPKSGFLRSRAIQAVINRVWFKSTKGKADAIALKESYKLFPRTAVALVLTAVCVLDFILAHPRLISPPD